MWSWIVALVVLEPIWHEGPTLSLHDCPTWKVGSKWENCVKLTHVTKQGKVWQAKLMKEINCVLLIQCHTYPHIPTYCLPLSWFAKCSLGQHVLLVFQTFPHIQSVVKHANIWHCEGVCELFKKKHCHAQNHTVFQVRYWNFCQNTFL